MAKAKKKTSKKFYIGYSGCGEMVQFEFMGHYGAFASVEAAKNKIMKDIADGELNDSGSYIVIQHIATGKPTGALNWK